MIQRMLAFCLIVMAMAGLSGAAMAKTWTVDYAHSRLGFAGTQGGVPFQGSFQKFNADINFDPDHPEAGTITVTVETGSATTGDEERDSTMPQSDWFDVSKFPQAQFSSTSIRKTGVDQYEAKGALKIKGLSHPVTLPFTLTHENTFWHAQGKTTLMRNDFDVGEGTWADEKTVKFTVDVTVDIMAQPNP